jgi:hypothetical protein
MSAEFFRKYLNILNESKKLDEFAPPSGGGVGGGRGVGWGGDGGGDGDGGSIWPTTKPPTYEIRLGENPNVDPKYLAIGEPQSDKEFAVYSLDCSNEKEPSYYGCHMTLVSRLPWTDFLDRIIGKQIELDDALEMGYMDVNDQWTEFYFTDKKFDLADKKKLRSAGNSNERGVAEIVFASHDSGLGINDVDYVYKNIRTGKIVAYVVGNDRHL